MVPKMPRRQSIIIITICRIFRGLLCQDMRDDGRSDAKVMFNSNPVASLDPTISRYLGFILFSASAPQAVLLAEASAVPDPGSAPGTEAAAPSAQQRGGTSLLFTCSFRFSRQRRC